MSVEYYDYDAPLGLYGFESKERLAQAIVRDFNRYERTATAIAPAFFELEEGAAPIDGEFRLSSLVAEDDSTAHALAIASTTNKNHLGTEGIYYKVSFNNEPEVVESKSIFITHPNLLSSKYAEETDLSELLNRFDKPELEAVMRMIGKLATSLEVAEQMSRAADRLTKKTLPTHLLSPSAALKKVATIEPRVQYALQHYNLDNLSELYPARQPAEPSHHEPLKEEAHILEWQDFLDGVSGYFRRETDASQPRSAVALQHVVGGHQYVMRFQAEYGEPSKIQILCWNEKDTWDAQEFELKSDRDEDDMSKLTLSPVWDKAALLQAVTHGELITNEIYEGYLAVAAEDPRTGLPDAAIDDIQSGKRKRPAA